MLYVEDISYSKPYFGIIYEGMDVSAESSFLKGAFGFIYTTFYICGLGGCFEVGALLRLCTNHIYILCYTQHTTFNIYAHSLLVQYNSRNP